MPSKAELTDLKCSVCEEPADGQHFGANACRACAAFFRRTVARGLTYNCRFNGQCEINQSYRCMCRSCRLAKCLSQGMRKEAVQRSRVPSDPIKSQLKDEELKTDFNSNGFITAEHHNNNKLIKEDASPQSDAPSTSSPPPSYSPTTALVQRLKSLQLIIDQSRKTILFDPATLPPTHPYLTKMFYGYEELQQQRDYQFCRSSDIAGVSTRTFVEKEFLDMTLYVQMMYAEVTNVAHMLNLFHGYNDLPTPDKIILFKNFWIHFTILERCFDTYRVLGPNASDQRMVFSDGSIVNVIEDRIKADAVTECDVGQVYNMLRPWFKVAAETLCPAVKLLQPTPIEMTFCFGMMLYGSEDQFSPSYTETRTAELSSETLNFMRSMTDALYSELNAYYQTELSVPNVVERVGELMRFISRTERMVMYRKEDILMTRTFGVFKIDIYLEKIFNEQ